jgi:hypothetical protein
MANLTMLLKDGQHIAIEGWPICAGHFVRLRSMGVALRDEPRSQKNQACNSK